MFQYMSQITQIFSSTLLTRNKINKLLAIAREGFIIHNQNEPWYRKCLCTEQSLCSAQLSHWPLQTVREMLSSIICMTFKDSDKVAMQSLMQSFNGNLVAGIKNMRSEKKKSEPLILKGLGSTVGVFFVPMRHVIQNWNIFLSKCL